MGKKLLYHISKAAKTSHKILLGFLILCITFYQKHLSYLFPTGCKYYPTCSEFSKQSFRKHGIIKGVLLSIVRIIKCNPFSKGGINPVR